MNSTDQSLWSPVSFRVVAVDGAAIENDRWRERVKRGFDAVAQGAMKKVVFLLQPEGPMKHARGFAPANGVLGKGVFVQVKTYKYEQTAREIYLAGDILAARNLAGSDGGCFRCRTSPPSQAAFIILTAAWRGKVLGA